MSEPLQILLVEDNPDHVFLARREFKNSGANVQIHHAEDSQATLNFLASAETLPDGILLDIKLPGRDGFELLVLLKDDETTKEIPVILLSSSPIPSDIERAARLGAASYFTKPVNAQMVLDILNQESRKE
jgi:CheY-like chemotaxis protein